MATAVFSSRSRIALVNDQGATKVVVSERQLGDLSPLDTSRADAVLSLAQDQQVLHEVTENEFQQQFENSVQGSEALDLVLFLLDRKLSAETHVLAADELNELLANEFVARYLHQIFYTKPLPATANIDGAIEISREYSRATSFLSQLAESQTPIAAVRAAWEGIDLQSVSQEIATNKLSADEVEGILVRHGVFFEIASALRNGANPVEVWVRFSKDSDLTRELPSFSRVMNEWIKPLPRGRGIKVEAGMSVGTSQVIELSTSPSSTNSFAQRTKPKALKALESALAQVDKISELATELKDAQAAKMLDELIAEQLRFSGGATYAVKSLCNIAAQTRRRQRGDFATKCLLRAFELNSTDPVVYFQLGTQLRDSQLYSEARRAYDKSLEYGDKTDVYRVQTTLSAKAHVLTEQDLYDEAIREYESIPFCTDSFSIRNSIADLYRRKGNFREAMSRYLDLIQLDGTFHRAFAGKAEIAKRRGDPHRAIRVYNSLLTNAKFDVDEESYIVYQVARSGLFKRVGQFEKAIEIARNVLELDPNRLQSKVQLASLLTLTGKPSLSLAEAIRKEVGWRDRWRIEMIEGLRLFSQNNHKDAVRHLVEEVDISSAAIDEQPLAKCAVAMAMISSQDSVGARELLGGVAIDDRTICEFRQVLQYHSLLLDRQQMKIQLPHLRRTSPEIRMAADSLREGNLQKALKHEIAFVLRAA
jgi:tetratricopeptide (TPR) repeat protein